MSSDGTTGGTVVARPPHDEERLRKPAWNGSGGNGSDRSGGVREQSHRTATDMAPAAPRVPVHISSSDAVAVAGVGALLAGSSRVRVLADDESRSAAVAIHVEKRLSTADLQQLRRCREQHATEGSGPVAAVLAVTDGFADDDLLAALDAGVSGMLRRSEAGRPQLVSAVLALADGAVLLPPRMQGLLVQHLRRVRTEVLDPNGLTLSGLTARERDVLRLVAEGLDTDEIATQLAFSPRTVKYVLTHLMTRYGLRSRTHAVAYAVRVGAI